MINTRIIHYAGNFVKVNSKGETKSDGRVKCHKLNIPQIVKHKDY